MDRSVIKYMKFNYWKLPLRSLLANMEAQSYASELANSFFVLVDVLWLAEALNKGRQRQFSSVL
jgi:hypothetical protein